MHRHHQQPELCPPTFLLANGLRHPSTLDHLSSTIMFHGAQRPNNTSRQLLRDSEGDSIFFVFLYPAQELGSWSFEKDEFSGTVLLRVSE